MLTENICCNCHWYEGVKAVPGTAPCSKHNKQVLWNEDCDEIWLIPERLKVEKENQDVRPVMHGKWKKRMEEKETPYYKSFTPVWSCSECGMEYDPSLCMTINFCPNCGAMMEDHKE